MLSNLKSNRNTFGKFKYTLLVNQLSYQKMNRANFFLFFVFLATLAACRHTPVAPNYSIQKSTVSDAAMVVSPHPLASDVGVQILQQGGNAIDAAIAVQLALAVVYPRAGNIGGGGFMVIRNQEGKTDALDYREMAPQAAVRNMYLDSLDQVIDGLSRNGQLAAGVPGTVDGLIRAHQKYGKIPDFALLVEPAVKLANQGFKVTEEEADRLNRFQEDFKKYNTAPNPFLKEKWLAGHKLVQKELARTLQLIQQEGRAGFYEGETADDLVTEMKSGNGIITHDDLKNYEAKWRTPITGSYKNYHIISMPPPSSGGIALVQLLKIVEDYPLSEWGFQSTPAIHLMAEAERRVYADRAQHLGDSDFYPVPKDSLLKNDYLEERMSDFSLDSATTSENILAGNFDIQLESFETTHTSIVDAEGNAVSVTTTLNSNYGCKVWVDNAGFFLNNEMDDFSAKPGIPNQFGLIGAEANAIQPGKRMLSSMTPTIIEKDGQLFMVLGTPGGSTIITSVFQVFLNVAEFGMTLEEAVNAKRFHHQWLPDQIMIEKGALDETVKQELMELGHQLNEVEYIAKVKAIHCLPDGRLHGVADPRNLDDDAKGY